MLVLYATGFSFAYVMLSAGTGALILFGFVQATMFFWGLFLGERPRLLQYCGMLLALAGLVVLVLPGLETPSFVGACLMALAGISWGIYSIRGQGVIDPVTVTGDNFMRAVPLLIPLALFFLTKLEFSVQGVLIAVLSGGIASGIGYVIWYQALTTLSITRAATAQLFVPALAALGGICFLGEDISMNLAIAGAMIISGAGCYIFYRR
jgi:drug/metabolite transporter (DMT)-like permease